MNAVRSCQVVYIKTDNGVEGESTNFNLGRHSADTTNELVEIFRNECSKLLSVDKEFISIQLNIVENL